MTLRPPEREEPSALAQFIADHRRALVTLLGAGALGAAVYFYHDAHLPAPVPALADGGTAAPTPRLYKNFLSARFAQMMPPGVSPLPPETDGSKNPDDYIRKLKDFVIAREGSLWSSSLGIVARQLDEWYQENYLTPWEWVKIMQLIESGDYEGVDREQNELSPVVGFRYSLRNARSQGYISEDEERELAPLIQRDNLSQANDAFASIEKKEFIDVMLNHTAEDISIGLRGYTEKDTPELLRIAALPATTPEELDAKKQAVGAFCFRSKQQP